MLVVQCEGNSDGGQLGLEIAVWTGTGALVWKHTWNEENRMEHVEWEKGG